MLSGIVLEKESMTNEVMTDEGMTTKGKHA